MQHYLSLRRVSYDTFIQYSIICYSLWHHLLQFRKLLINILRILLLKGAKKNPTRPHPPHANIPLKSSLLFTFIPFESL